MTRPRVGLSLMIEPGFFAAASPLVEAGLVEALEWTPDIGWGRTIPVWAEAWLSLFGGEGQLYGHGFALSALTGAWEPRQAEWLRQMAAECAHRPYRHLSEHYGFASARGWAHTAPFPVPRTDGALRVGRDRLQRLAEVCRCPVGLENLATVFGRSDALEQGPFLERLLAPVDGFVLLDLHNLYCQLANFDLDAGELLATYPLARVRELHVSGGSWSWPDADPEHRPFRRDTHDQAVPDEVLSLVPLALDRCPNVELVIFERLGNTIHGDDDLAEVQNDYLRLRARVEEWADARRTP